MLQSIINYLNTISGGNQFIAGAMSAWLMTVMTYLLRNIPLTIYQFLKKQLTTTITISNDNKVFYTLQRWFEYNNISDSMRAIRYSNGRWGEDSVIKGIGVGEHFFYFKRNFMWVTLSVNEKAGSNKIIESISIMKIGRSHKVFGDIIHAANELEDLDITCTSVYRFKDFWNLVGKSRLRSFDTVCVTDDARNTLTNTIDKFVSSEKEYEKLGVPYQLGIILYGPPGTGKTSIIKALATKYSKNLAIISPNKMLSFDTALETLPKNCICIVEDIDSARCVLSRGGDDDDEDSDSDESWTKFKKRLDFKNKTKKDDDAEKIIRAYSVDELSDILNALDGIVNVHGRIIIATTNHIEKIDAAVLRPGRFDIKVYIGYITKETFIKFLGRFFPDHAPIDPDTFELISDTMTGAKLQQHLLIEKDYNTILSTYVRMK